MSVICLACRRSLETDDPITLRCPCGSRCFVWTDGETKRSSFVQHGWQQPGWGNREAA